MHLVERDTTMIRTQERVTETLPLLLAVAEPINADQIREALSEVDLIANSYDPVTQVSNIPLHAGTSRTYSRTKCGLVPIIDDDDTVSDS